MQNRALSRGATVCLWVLCFVLVVATAGWQRRTGPSYPLRGDAEVAAGEFVRYRLVRNCTSDIDATVRLPHAPAIEAVELRFRRHGTGEDFTAVEMRRAEGEWTGLLPRQPAAGKLDYFLVVNGGVRIPAGEGRFAVIRFKDPVPKPVLVPHIAMMFLSMFLGLRAAVAAFREPRLARRLTFVTLGCLTIGGLILGPVVQKYAFGAYWTGWPLGEDLTDNKTLVMWLGWAIAALVTGRQRPFARGARVAILAATLVMFAMYLVPHSLRGSTLDYERLEEGVSAEDAIRTG